MATAIERTTRPRSKSGFSFKSEKSHRSSGSVSKESPSDKRRSHLNPTGKANPNAAINEAQPVAAALEEPTLDSLRSFAHVDSYGNPIAEPDLSNPTRPRWERPLDTIKSFEAAIDHEYKRRSLIRADTAPDNSNYQSRRSSFYGGNQHSYNNSHDRTSRYSHTGGSYGNSSAVGRDSYYPDQYNHGMAPGPSRGRPNPRMMSDPHAAGGRYGGGQQMYPVQAYQRSRDTLNTGGSGSASDPYGNSTDPSSDNSSIERIVPLAKPEPGEQYGFAGFGGAPIMEEHRSETNYSQPHQNSYFPPTYPGAVAPPPPPHQSLNRRPIPLGATAQPPSSTGRDEQARPKTLSKTDSGEKRKSWFKRRFSKE